MQDALLLTGFVLPGRTSSPLMSGSVFCFVWLFHTVLTNVSSYTGYSLIRFMYHIVCAIFHVSFRLRSFWVLVAVSFGIHKVAQYTGTVHCFIGNMVNSFVPYVFHQSPRSGKCIQLTLPKAALLMHLPADTSVI